MATSNSNSSPNQNDLNRSGDQQKSPDQSERSHGLTGMKGLSVIFYLDDYGFYTTDLPPLHYKASMAKGKINTLLTNVRGKQGAGRMALETHGSMEHGLK